MHPPAAKKRSAATDLGEQFRIGWGPAYAGDPLTAAQAQRSRCQGLQGFSLGSSPDPFQLADGTWASGPAAIRARQAAANVPSGSSSACLRASPDPFQLPDGTWVSGPAAIRARQAASKVASDGNTKVQGASLCTGGSPDPFQLPDGSWVSGPAAIRAKQAAIKSETDAVAGTSDLDPSQSVDGRCASGNDRDTTIGLEHLSYLCPGLHDTNPAVAQVVKSTNFKSLLLAEGGLFVPCFQRTYCWSQEELLEWWHAVCHGKSSGSSCGKIVLAPSSRSCLEDHGTTSPMVIIDGQQRLTTTVLLIAALRDAACRLVAVSHPHDDVSVFVDMLNSILFHSKDVPRLTLSHRDRSTLAQLLSGMQDDDPNVAVTSNLVQGKVFFDSMLKKKDLVQLNSLATSVLDKLPVVAVTLSTCKFACQVYLWLQEKALFGESSLSAKASGRFLKSVDFARNLLLAPFLPLAQEEQERIHSEMWLPWESCYTSLEALDLACTEFVQAQYSRFSREHLVRQSTGLEQKLEMLSCQTDKMGIDIHAAQTYAKLVAVFSHLAGTLGQAGAARKLLGDLHKLALEKR